MQQGDYTSTTPYYHNYPPQNPNPNPNPNPTTTDPSLNYASSAPPPTTTYHPPYPPTAPSYANPQFETPYQPYNHPSSYDHHHTAHSYVPPIPPNHTYSSYNNPSFFETGYGGPDLGGGGGDYYGKRPELGMSRFESSGDGGGVYAYQGPSKVEPYGSRGTTPPKSWKKEQVLFDDFGRPIAISKDSASSSPKIVKAVPKAETREDVKGGVQKFRVKLLAESGGQSTMDVLCQVGLDGIRMLDPSSSRTLRIYPLDTITRCELYDSSTLAFWSKSSVDIEPRRIRLQSNSYTTNTLLDTVTAATIQVKEIGGRSRPVEAVKFTEQSTEKKKGLGDWMNIIKPANEEKDHWVPDEAVTKCTGCGSDFSAFNRKHHCRNCGDVFCDKCSRGRTALTSEDNAPQVRVCDRCMLEVTHRLSSAKEAVASRSSGMQSHEDLAKKLQELERNHKSSSSASIIKLELIMKKNYRVLHFKASNLDPTGFKSEGSNRRMKEVACPTCTVHLQVQVPSSGSETIECGVCQHPFLVNAR
ncbi:hypothetical protein SSX86_008302 [Deinandra increscens subsp. villosa]|uniref:FYVE-type domain-containing protein n=1 Tax=Deinandra increscens subsp. villosa TaxID=3103831 RepID=A0AAP0DFM6_9ASTR